MKRLVSAAVVALACAAMLTAAAVAAPAPGTYKGNLYAGATKLAPATITVAGTKVTIKVAKFPIKCQGPSGKFDQPSAPMKYEFKGTLKGNVVSGTYISPLGGTGEYFTAKLTYAAATKSFTGKVGFVGRCQGTSTLKAKKA
jgi:2',3'-cyclic-nucleotide 2'-phosphodiesterase (5'-nucleotidase family)